MMRGLAAALAVWLLARPVSAAVTLDPGFWEDYVPYQQYSDETYRNLRALEEGDLLETGREIDGLELRIVGRRSRYSTLISARAVIDRIALQRLQVKLLAYELPTVGRPEPVLRRRQISDVQARALVTLIERLGFWDAPYERAAAGPDAAVGLDCGDAGHWIVEAVRPGMYQLITRDECGGLDPLVAEIRDFLLELAGLPGIADDAMPGAD